jgi:FkbM family methyltransferase
MSYNLVRKLKTAGYVLSHGGAATLGSRLSMNLRVMAARATGVNIDGCIFKSSQFPEEIWRNLISHEYESQERQTIRQYLNPQSPLLELGGGMGVIACIANRALNHPRKHIVVEASPQFVPIIQTNADRNKCELTIVNAAIAYGCDHIKFWVNAERPYSSALMPVHAGAVEITVPATTLDALLKQYGMTGCTLVCDIEGEECEMVKNELPTLAQHVSTIMMETHPKLVGRQKTDEMIAALTAIGFQTKEIVSDVYVMARA